VETLAPPMFGKETPADIVPSVAAFLLLANQRRSGCLLLVIGRWAIVVSRSGRKEDVRFPNDSTERRMTNDRRRATSD
jgi:hypothetical protein